MNFPQVIRSHIKLWLLTISFLSPWIGKTADGDDSSKCEDHILDTIPPAHLDKDGVQNGVEELIRKEKDLSKTYQELKELRRQLFDHPEKIQELAEKAKQLKDRVENEGRDYARQHYRGNPEQLTPDVHRRLEAYKQLIRGSRDFQQITQQVNESEELQKELEQQKEKRQEKERKEAEDQAKNQQAEQGQGEQGNQGKDQQQGNQQGQEGQQQGDQGNQQGQEGQQQGEQGNQQGQEGQQQGEQGNQQGQEGQQQGDQSQQGQSQEKEGNQGKDQEQGKQGQQQGEQGNQQGQEGHQQGDQGNQQGQEGQQQGDQGNQQGQEGQQQGEQGNQQGQEGQQQGEQGNQQGQEGQQQGDQGNQQGQEGQQQGQQGNQQGQEGQQQSQESGHSQGHSESDGQTEKEQDGESSNSSGKEDGAMSEFAKKLAEFLKKKGLGNFFEKELEKETKDNKSHDQWEDDFYDRLIEENQDRKQKREKDWADQWEDEWENDRPSRKKSSKWDKIKDKLKSISNSQVQAMLLSFLDDLWKETLRNYSSSARLEQAIFTFENISQSLLSVFPIDGIKQRFVRANELRDHLKRIHLSYQNFQELGLSMLQSSPDEVVSIVKKLDYLEKVLDSLQQVTTLTATESELLKYIKTLQDSVEQNVTADQKDRWLAKGFQDLLSGPLSHSLIRESYPIEDSTGEINYTSLASAIRANAWNDLILYGRLSPYFQFLTHESLAAKIYEDYSGKKVPINESDSEIGVGDEFDNWKRFLEDGMPNKFKAIRVLFGEQLERVYRDEVQLTDPITPKPRKVSIVLFDTSGSMAGERTQIRNGIIAAYLDDIQKEVLAKEISHTVYLVPFDSNVRPDERLDSYSQFKDYFNRLRQNAHGASGGTNITVALNHALKRIYESQEEGGELARANILMITDGEDSGFKEENLQANIDKIDPKTEIVLNTIAIQQGNSQLKQLAEKHQTDEHSRWKSSYQLITGETTSNLINTPTYVKKLDETAHLQDTSLDSKIRSRDVMQLKHLLTSLGMEQNQNLLRDSGFFVEELDQALNDVGEVVLAGSDPQVAKIICLLLDAALSGDVKNLESSLKSLLMSFEKTSQLSMHDVLASLPVDLRNRLKSVIKDLKK